MKCPCCGHDIEEAPKEALMSIPELSLMERSIVREVLSIYPRGMTVGELAARLWPYGGGPDCEKNSVMVLVHKARKKLAPFGWTIPRNRAGHIGTYKLERL